MKILFICKSNVGRSQMAEAFFNKFSKHHEAISAGVDAENHSGKKVCEISNKIPPCMLEAGIDVSEKISKPLAEDLVKQSDFIVWIAPEEDVPNFVPKEKFVLWDVEDAGGKTYRDWCVARDKIKKLVLNLIESLDNS